MLRVNHLVGFGTKRPAVASIPSVMLLHMDGVDGSTTFADVYGHTINVGGNAQVDTAQFKFGGASLLLDGTGDYLNSPDSVDWDFGTGDFTIESFIRPASTTGTPVIIGRQGTGSSDMVLQFRISSGAKLEAVLAQQLSGPIYTLTGTTTISNATWYHIALTRLSGVFNIWLDGISEANLTQTLTLDGAFSLSIGDLDQGGVHSNYFNGHLDEVRVTKGTARYTSTFTPPSSAFIE